MKTFCKFCGVEEEVDSLEVFCCSNDERCNKRLVNRIREAISLASKESGDIFLHQLSFGLGTMSWALEEARYLLQKALIGGGFVKEPISSTRGGFWDELCEGLRALPNIGDVSREVIKLLDIVESSPKIKECPPAGCYLIAEVIW